MARQIEHYQLAWHPGRNSGDIRVVLYGGKTIHLAVRSPQELTALATILRETPVFLQDDGTITTGWEPLD